MEDAKEIISHDVIITSRKRLQMTGIKDVVAFDDGQIMAQNDNSDISIEGESLKIEKFDSASGDLIVNGKIDGVLYYAPTNQKKKRSFVGLFK